MRPTRSATDGSHGFSVMTAMVKWNPTEKPRRGVVDLEREPFAHKPVGDGHTVGVLY